MEDAIKDQITRLTKENEDLKCERRREEEHRLQMIENELSKLVAAVKQIGDEMRNCSTHQRVLFGDPTRGDDKERGLIWDVRELKDESKKSAERQKWLFRSILVGIGGFCLEKGWAIVSYLIHKP